MEGRRIRVQEFLTEQEALTVIRNSYDPEYPAQRVISLRDDAVNIPFDPPVAYPTKPTLGTVNRAGIPIGISLTPMTPAQVNALAPGVVVQDKIITGTIIVEGAVPRVFTNCMLQGTTTENELETVGGELQVKVANAPNYAISNATTGTPFVLNNCEVKNASKLLLCPGGATLDHCYLHDAGEDAIHASTQWSNISATDTIISRCGNLRYHSKVGWKTSLMHADLSQLRGQLAGVSSIYTRVVFSGEDANTQGGPTGDGWGRINACVIAQTGAAPIFDVRLIDCWLASGGNWMVYMESKNFGQIENFTITGCEWAQISSSGPLVNHGASVSSTISGNIDKAEQANIDAILEAGTGW